MLQIGKDPDVRIEALFVVGDVMPVQVCLIVNQSANLSISSKPESNKRPASQLELYRKKPDWSI